MVSWRRALVLVTCVVLGGAGAAAPPPAAEPGLLFYLSGEKGLTADFAASGQTQPNFSSDVRPVADGAKGQALECGHTQLLSYFAPGNIFAQRGTLSFYWRSREPVGPTPFPIFRVGYGDHSSWDMVWLRIDYNGRGFDAFVTDVNLARTRVSFPVPSFPAPNVWVHLALSWDETRGIRFYVDGRMVAKQDGVAVFDAALDQFGPHSRVISPYQVQSAYNFVRGGDIDELRIYDRMLSDDNVGSLAHGETPSSIPSLARPLDQAAWQAEWWLRNGWNRAGDVPPALDAATVGIRKVEIHDAIDIKRWWWKGTDGIRETTWPGVYNRSRIRGRNDYFQLPDWDCYSLSGKSVTFEMPDEPWNQVEISGAAWGSARLAASATSPAMSGDALFERPQGQERTFHRLASPVRGKAVTFTNVEQETPIGEFGAYYVAPAKEPAGIGKLTYRLTAQAEPNQPSVAPALAFINGRYAADERALMVAVPPAAPRAPRSAPAAALPGLPIVHILVPADFRDTATGGGRADSVYSWMNLPGGLDGIALDLPALKVKPTHGAVFPLRIQVKDPVWPLRNMLDISVSVRPGEARTVWLDTRDRLLTADKGLYMSITGAGPDFGPASLEGAELRLVFKPRQAALAEHTLDRFTQVRDNYAHLVEESPRTRRLSLYTRWETDLTDLLRVDPDHVLGRQYWYDYNKEQPAPPVTIDAVPPGVPGWAFRQVELLRGIKRFVNWYVDNRQIDNGEFGGGLSDDGDLTNAWPGTAFMGGDPGKLARSLDRHMDAFYQQGLFTNGLSTIQADELHSYEEGIQVLGQVMLLDFGDPIQLERAMNTAAALERITGINKAGHRHIRSSYFSGTTIAEEGVWGWQKTNSLLALHPAISLVDYNGSPHVKQWLLEIADGLIAHYLPDASGRRSLRTNIEFATDREQAPGVDRMFTSDRAWPLLWAAYRWTGDRTYVQPMLDIGPRSLSGLNANVIDHLGLRQEWGGQLQATGGRGDNGRHLAWQLSGDVKQLEAMYEDQVRAIALREYINTDGSLWIDRVNVPMTEIQRERLGGVALVRNMYVPGHAVSWRFDGSDDEKVAVLIPDATPQHLTVVGYNLDASAVRAQMTTWDIDPGQWEVTVGTRPDPASGAVTGGVTTRVDLDRSSVLPVTFAPRTCTVVELRLVSKGMPYWTRPDLAVARNDIRVTGSTMSVTVHNVGAAATPAARVVLRDRAGREVARTTVRSLEAPSDLKPRKTTVTIRLPGKSDWAGGSLSVEAVRSTLEITARNNAVKF
jgi:hypothetical protein